MAKAAKGLTPAPTITVTAPTPFAAGIHTQPSFDVIELLPPAAADKLRQLRQRASDAHRLTVPYEDIRQASMARIEAENALKRLTNHPHDHGFRLKPDDRRVIEATKTLEKAEVEFKRLQERQATRAAAFQAASQAPAKVEDWLRNGRPSGVVLQDFDGPVPKLAKGEDVLSGIERLRRRARELKADLHRIESAPYPSSRAKAQMRAQVEALATQGAPSVSNLIEHDAKIEWPTQRVQSEVFAEQRALAFAEVPDTVALIAWLHKDALIASLDREIASEADDKAALSHTDRELRTSETMSDLLAVERDESALVWQAQAQSLPCEHRPDISPLAVLGVALVTAQRAIDGPSTSTLTFDIVRPGGR